jgi:hypothetical protein
MESYGHREKTEDDRLSSTLQAAADSVENGFADIASKIAEDGAAVRRGGPLFVHVM